MALSDSTQRSIMLPMQACSSLPVSCKSLTKSHSVFVLAAPVSLRKRLVISTYLEYAW